MSQVRVNESSLVDIAEAIREKSGKSNTYTPSEMGDAVRELPTRIPVTESITITANGTYEAPAEIDGYSEVIAQVAPNNTTIEITDNGTYTPDGYDGFSEVIVNTPMLSEEDLTISENCSRMFEKGKFEWMILKYGNKMSSKNITDASYMFSQCSKITEIPFDLNFADRTLTHDLSCMFQYCLNLTEVPKFNSCKPEKLSNIFNNCQKLRYLPEDFDSWFDWSFFENENNLTWYWYGERINTFSDCHSLRSFPIEFLNHYNFVGTNGGGFNTIYYSLFQRCNALDEVIGLPVHLSNDNWTSDAFHSTFSKCNRLKNMTFATLNGQPYVVNWKNQMIDLSQYVGYSNSVYNIYSYNSGITADKEVYDDVSYQALKNDPDWFTGNHLYSRYNHDSAVATINSLPDTSAYLATAGGTNTIKFYGAAGSKTDGGAINNLTEEEIAVATAKGWTVSLV